MRDLLRNSLLCLLVAYLVAACNEDVVYHSYYTLPNKGWEKSDTLTFVFPVTDSLSTYRLYAEVRNRCEYPFHDLHLFVHTHRPAHKALHTDTVSIHLANEKGQWLGKGWGSLYQSTAFIKSVRPLHLGNYTIRITSGMKNSWLKGLNDIGLRIERLNSTKE